ncbi:helix-turn-helix transcriptional regulator [Streptomyces sp. NPDC002343]
MSGQTTPGTGAERYRPGPVAALGERLREGGACVLTGEPGGGRSTVLARVARAFDAGPAVVVPALPERCRQPLAGLRALCRAAGVPAADAAGPVGDLIGALRRTAAPGTVLLCADDADLWDTASRTALGRLAARLSPGDGVSLLLTVAGHRPVDPEFAGLPLLRLAPLSTADAAALLDDAAPGALDPRVRDEITAAAEGNPGLLLGVMHRLTPAQLGGLAPLPCPLVDAEALTALTAPHLSGLPPAERDLLLVTAAALHASEEPTVEAEVVARAVRSLADDGTPSRPLPERRADGGALPDSGSDAVPGPGAGGGVVPGRGFGSPGEEGGAGWAVPVRGSDAVPGPDAGSGVVSGYGSEAVRSSRVVDGAEPGRGPDSLPSARADGGPVPGGGRDPLPEPHTDGGSTPGHGTDSHGTGVDRLPPGGGALPEALFAAGGRLGFRSTVLCRAVYAGAAPERRRAAHEALAQALPDAHGLPALLHRSWAATAPAPALAAALASAAADPASAAPPTLRCTGHTRAAELAPDGADRVRWYTAAAEQALLAGQSARALRLLDTARCRPAPAPERARAELLRGTALRWDGPVDDARETLLLAAALAAPYDPERSAEAALAAADAAWSAGDVTACLRALAQGGWWTGTHRTETPDAGLLGQSPSGDPPMPAGLPLSGRDLGAVDEAPEVGLFGQAPSASPPVPGGLPLSGRDLGAVDEASGAGPSGQSPSGGPPMPAGRTSVGLDPGAQEASGAGRVAQPPSGTPSPLTGALTAERDAGAAEAVGAGLVGQSPPVSAGPFTAARDPGAAAALRDHRAGMRAVLQGRFDRAVAPLRRVVERAWTADGPEELLRAASAALLLGDTAAARRAGARALAVARTHGAALHEARALEYLAYGELRAGRHALARAHAEEGVRSAARSGQRNTAAHHHAVLALAASIAGEAHTVAEHATAAMAIARRHGLAQAAALAQWALARADLGHGRPREAAERLAPLVRPGSERGHFAVWMLAVPCYVEACALARQPEGAGDAVEDFALWVACEADAQAPAQLLRCRALLAPPEAADALYRQALRRHDEAAGDFERARTELLYGKWLRRRRRLREARTHLRAALLGFERCGAGPWAQQAAAELRANGVIGAAGALGADGPGGAVSGGAEPPDGLARLTPQQLRIARRVAQGLTNREVALSLSVSTRTVDYHLRKVFAALGVRSRVELARLVEQAGQTVGRP